MSAYDGIQKLKIGGSAVLIDGKLYDYDVISPALAPGVPNFVGFVEGNLFISGGVPRRFRRPILAHEVRCFALKGEGHTGHCVCAVDYELKFVLAEDRPEYLALRRKFFNDLIQFSHGADATFMREIVASRDYLYKLT